MRSPRTLERPGPTAGGHAAGATPSQDGPREAQGARRPPAGRPATSVGATLAGVSLLAAVAAIVFPYSPGYALENTAADVVAAVIVAAAAASVPSAASLARPRAPDRQSGAAHARFAAALLSAAAAAIHLAVVKMHFEEYFLFGVFFVSAGIAQLAWAVWLVVRPSRPLLVLGATGNVMIAALWAVDRIWGLPLGPDRWTPEPVGFADGVTSGFELVLALCCVALLLDPVRQSLQRRRVGSVAQAALLLVVVSITALGLLSVAGVAPSLLAPAA